MRKLVYATSLSFDGFIDAQGGDPSWVFPDEELHRHFNETEREIDTLLYGRRMYELMAGYWPTADQDPSAPAVIVGDAPIWTPMPPTLRASGAAPFPRIKTRASLKPVETRTFPSGTVLLRCVPVSA